MKTKRLVSNIFFYVIMTMCCFIFLFPFYWMITSSFKPLAQIFEMPFRWIPRTWTMENFQKGWAFMGGVTFSTIYKNTFFVAIMSVIGTVTTASLTAFAFARIRFKGRGVLFIILLSTMMLPHYVTMIPNYMLYTSLGLVNTQTVLFLGSFWGGGAFNVFMIRQFMMGIPLELDEAAKIDGASTFTIYWRIILPLCKSVLLTVTVFAFTGTYNDLMTPLIYIRDLKKTTVAPAINMFLDSSIGVSSRGTAIAMTTLSVLPLIIIFFIVQKQFMQGVQTVGIKG